jgi:translation elongation factor EF-Ts
MAVEGSRILTWKLLVCTRRYVLGEGIERQSKSLAEEVANIAGSVKS